jgi:hypothetical protein
MEIIVYVLPGGEIQVMIDGKVAFSEASARTAELLGAARADGVPMQPQSPTEQHKPDVDHVHVVRGHHVQQH